MSLELFSGFFPIVRTRYAESFVSKFTEGEKAMPICMSTVQTECFLMRQTGKELSMETYLSDHIENFFFYVRNFQVSAYCLVDMALDC